MTSITLQQQVVASRITSEDVDVLRGTDAVRWIQEQAVAKGKPYLEVEKLEASAHVWAQYYERFGQPTMKECLAAARALVGGGK